MQGLIGTWRSESASAGKSAFGSVTQTFSPDGTLLYISHGDDKDQIIRLTFRIEPGFIVTDQPSKPRCEKTAYEFTQDGKLLLTFAEEKTLYVRVE